MNKDSISEICTQFNLGEPVDNPLPITGGLLHLMWKLETNKGTYAIKQLSKDIKLTKAVKKTYALTEQIADKFKHHGIPAVNALAIQGKHLIEISGTGFLIYPWVDAKALDKDAISERHALQISKLLAKMHLINLDIPEIVAPEFDIHPMKKIIQLINNAISFQCPFADNLKENQNRIAAINNVYHNAIPLLKESIVVSHGDLDQKNVLWDQNDAPILIDWESARKLNPTYEITDTSLNWSGITTENFNPLLFIEMIRTYQTAGGTIDEKQLHAAFYGVLGNWLNWMAYNIKRACNADNKSDQRAIGTEQVQQVIPTIIRLESLITKLITAIIKN